MNKLLAVSWSFPPVILPRAFQVSRTLIGLKDAGWDASVITVDPASIARVYKSDPSMAEETDRLFEITRVPSTEDSLPARAVWRLFPPLALLPDPRVVWISAASRQARGLLDRGGYCGILSFAQPWSDHLIGRALHREFHLPWIAHFSDPWADNPYYPASGWAASLRLRMETQVIRDADAVIFVSEQTRDLVMRKYPPEWSPKAHVIPHCFVPMPVPSEPEEPIGPGNPPLRLAYTGGFYGRRTPISLFEALARLRQEMNLAGRIQVEIAGPGAQAFQSKLKEYHLEDIVNISPLVPHRESQRIAGRADVLLVIDAPSQDVNVFLPSKLVDYLAFHKPIFGITAAKGATADLLRELDCPLAETEDVAAIAAVLRDLLARKEAGTLAVSDKFETVAARYDVRNTTRQYLDLLERYFGTSCAE